ncbi:hypothetical protein CONLIGDRAFT_293198 [Coniochaeta ligniaria NRRL 30616]|uniref:Uncharacterized protein n=1 Tax=Coniochaeta ligniaria NRRL 30616 TaxID=1408157 RepID=A0A1J7ITP8_9PEZI|nr:hypothetical protein CONLIGDRAFT_293198 [Coniochaeta ligniaria NRRL 30616]
MASPSSSNRVQVLGTFWENEAFSGSRNLPGGIPEREKQVIDDGLGGRLSEVEKRRTAGQSSPPPVPPRPKRSVGKGADTAITPSAEDDGEEEGDRETPLSNEESQSLTPDGPNVRELKEQSQQAHRKIEELTAQHRDCARNIQALNDQISTLEEQNIDLITAGSAGKAQRAELRRQIDDLRGKLEQANIQEDALRRELEDSRQMENNLRKQLVEAELQAVRQLRDSENREYELQQQLHRAEREREEAVAQGQRGLVSGQHSQGDSGLQTPGTQQVVGGRSPDYGTREQQREDHLLGQENRELVRTRPVARSEAESAAGRELARPQKKKKERKEQRGGLYRSRNNKTAV